MILLGLPLEIPSFQRLLKFFPRDFFIDFSLDFFRRAFRHSSFRYFSRVSFRDFFEDFSWFLSQISSNISPAINLLILIGFVLRISLMISTIPEIFSDNSSKIFLMISPRIQRFLHGFFSRLLPRFLLGFLQDPSTAFL